MASTAPHLADRPVRSGRPGARRMPPSDARSALWTQRASLVRGGRGSLTRRTSWRASSSAWQDQPGGLPSMARRRRSGRPVRRPPDRPRAARQGRPLRPVTCTAHPGTRTGCRAAAARPSPRRASWRPARPRCHSCSAAARARCSMARSATSRSRRRRSAASVPRGTVGRPGATGSRIPDARPIRRSPRSMPSSLTGRSGSGERPSRWSVTVRDGGHVEGPDVHVHRAVLRQGVLGLGDRASPSLGQEGRLVEWAPGLPACPDVEARPRRRRPWGADRRMDRPEGRARCPWAGRGQRRRRQWFEDAGVDGDDLARRGHLEREGRAFRPTRPSSDGSALTLPRAAVSSMSADPAGVVAGSASASRICRSSCLVRSAAARSTSSCETRVDSDFSPPFVAARW